MEKETSNEKYENFKLVDITLDLNTTPIRQKRFLITITKYNFFVISSSLVKEYFKCKQFSISICIFTIFVLDFNCS